MTDYTDSYDGHTGSRSLYTFTVVWEIIGGDFHVSVISLPDREPTEEGILLALATEDGDDTSSFAILAMFAGRHETVWGAAIPT